jgi:hypothetical protein
MGPPLKLEPAHVNKFIEMFFLKKIKSSPKIDWVSPKLIIDFGRHHLSTSKNKYIRSPEIIFIVLQVATYQFLFCLKNETMPPNSLPEAVPDFTKGEREREITRSGVVF